MKTKFMYLGLAAAMMAGLNSCSNDTTADMDNKETKTVSLKLDLSGPATYGEQAPKTSTSVTFATGDLYFVNATGVIVDHYTIGTGATYDIQMSALTSGTGAMLTDIPGTAFAAHVVGNTPSLPTSGSINLVKAAVLNVTSQTNIEAVNLYGSALLVPPVAPATHYTCPVPLTPTVARIELTDIQAAATSVITGFEVEGVFVDGYYTQATVDGSVALANLEALSTADTDFVGGTAKYPAGLTPAVYDYYSSALTAAGTPLTVATPGTGQVWAYNLFAASTGSDMPRIVVRLKNITTSDGSTYADPQFLTITGLKSGATSLTAIQSGHVYNIGTGGLTFDESKLTPTPNTAVIDVEVLVTVSPWTIVPVTAEL